MTEAEAAAYARGVEETRALLATVATMLPALVQPGAPVVTLSDLAHRIAQVDPRALRILRPYDRREAITLKEAADIAGRSDTTVRQWVDLYGIGRHVVGSVMVSQPALLMVLDDDVLALAAYLSGDRGPIVRPYFTRAGLVGVAA